MKPISFKKISPKNNFEKSRTCDASGPAGEYVLRVSNGYPSHVRNKNIFYSTHTSNRAEQISGLISRKNNQIYGLVGWVFQRL